jgi:hypothetical protein
MCGGRFGRPSSELFFAAVGIMLRSCIFRMETSMTVWIYIDTSKQVGDRDFLKVFAD